MCDKLRHALVYGWQICQRVIITQGQLLPTLLQGKIIPKDLDSSHELTPWSLKRSIGESGTATVLIPWLQHQPCGEVDIMLHPCRLRALKCNLNYQNQSNGSREMNSTVCQAEGKKCARHRVLRPLLTLHRVGRALYPDPYWHNEFMYFLFINMTEAYNAPCIVSRDKYAVHISY